MNTNNSTSISFHVKAEKLVNYLKIIEFLTRYADYKSNIIFEEQEENKQRFYIHHYAEPYFCLTDDDLKNDEYIQVNLHGIKNIKMFLKYVKFIENYTEND